MTLPYTDRLQIYEPHGHAGIEGLFIFRQMGTDVNSSVTNILFVRPGHEQVGPIRLAKNKLMPGDAVTCDLGCVYQGHCSDFGRSAFVGEPPKEYVGLHDLVLRSQRAGMRAMQAGQVTGAYVIQYPI